MRKTAKYVIVAVVAVVAVCVVVACGGSSSSSSGSPSSGSQEPIKLGIPVPISGSMAADGLNMIQGADLAVSQINAAGGIAGRPIEIVKFDTSELLAETWQSAAQELVVKDKVDGAVAGQSGEAGPDVFGKYEVPFIFHEPSQFVIDEVIKKNGYTNCFMDGGTSGEFGQTLFQTVTGFAQDGGYQFANKDVGALLGQWTAEREEALGMLEHAKAEGWNVVMQQDVAEGTKELGGTVDKLRSLKPSMLIIAVWDYAAMMSIKKDFMSDPWPCLIYWCQPMSISEYKQNLTAAQDSEMGMAPGGILPNAKGDELKKAYAAAYPGQEMSSPFSLVASYDGVCIWANAVKQVIAAGGQPSDHKAVCDAIKASAWEGAGGTYKFNSDYYVSAQDAPCHVYQVQDGKMVLFALTNQLQPGVTFVKPPWE